MLKQLLTGLAAVAVATTMSAKPITPDEALSRLRESNARMSAPGKSGKAPRLIHTTKTTKGNPAVYIFNQGDNNGYMVLSADDAAYPLLGYSDNGNADAANLPPALEWWLGEYARQIEYVNENGISTETPKTNINMRSTWQPIAPLIKTKWDQVEPYYNQCPLYGVDRTFTGCVATAMAQVAKYWNYPRIGTGSISYECSDLSKRLSMNFALKEFDWDNMCDTYLPGQYTEKEADAVAYLMKACGYSVKMSYSTDSSGALAMNIANGLTKYLGYDKNILYDQRMYHSASEWEQIIYDNLKNVGPILYGGGSMLGGGHSFVLDGYDGNGMFHFNWGWSGMSDGYFSLDALNPNSLGTGGGAGGGYNFTQDAVLGIQPPTGKPVEERPIEMTQLGSLSGNIEEGVLSFTLTGEGQAMWVNYNPSTLKMMFGAIFEPQGNTGGETIRKEVSSIKFNIQPGYGTDPAHLKPTVNLADAGLKDGTYKVTFASILIETGGDDIWTPVKQGYGYSNYVIVKKAGDTYTVENSEVDYIELVGAEYKNTLYFGGLAKVAIEIANESDIELTKGFAPVLINTADGYPYFIGESIYVTLAPKTTAVKEWVSSLNLVQNVQITSDMEFYIAFMDEGTANFFVSEDKIVMHPNPGAPNMTLMGLARIAGERVTEELPNGTTSTVTVINDPNNIEISATVRLQSGIFAYNCLAFIVDPFNESEQGTQIFTMAGAPMFMESAGLRSSFKATAGYPLLIPGKHYAVIMGYQFGSNYVSMSNAQPSYFRVAGTSAVDELPAENATEEDGEIFNLQGISLGYDYDSLPAGLYIRNGKKIMKK